MRPLAALLRLRGGDVTGSDRAFDRGGGAPARAALEAIGVRIVPQDGSGTAGADRVVVSTAVEGSNADIAAARRAGVPVVHRAAALAEIAAAASLSIGVAGTSGKTTTVGMLVSALRGAGRNPTAYAGAAFVGIDAPLGVVAGDPDLLVFEADESDGSIERYAPTVGVILNAALDHKPLPEIARMFAAFAGSARTAIDARSIPVEAYADDGWGSRFEAVVPAAGGRRVAVRLAVPGRHNAANAAAALAAAVAVGCDAGAAAAGLAAFRGMRRRLEVVAERDSLCVVDDYAHNPDKVRAAVAAVRARYHRTAVVYQPHGYGPTRFLLEPLAAAFAESLAGGGRLVLLPIYDAGGTADRSISSADLAAAVAARGGVVETVPDRAGATDRATAFLRAARPSAAVVMGARDETLADLARDLARSVGIL